MNTAKSFWYGWGALVVAGGGAYIFAKRSINADRLARHSDQEAQRRREQSSLQSGGTHATPQRSTMLQTDHSASAARSDIAGSPSREANQDPAPTRHAPENEKQRVTEKSKYEASQPFRAKKGDRFS